MQVLLLSVSYTHLDVYKRQLLRFISHCISGVVFFGSYAPEGISPIIYSLSVNGLAVGGELMICLVLLAFLPVERLVKMLKSNIATI